MYGFPKKKTVYECIVCKEWHEDFTIEKKANSQGSMTCNKCKTVYREKADSTRIAGVKE